MEKLTISVEGTPYAFWTKVSITQALDTFATISLSAPFEAKRKEFRKIFQPFSYKPIKVLINDKDLFTGTLIEVAPQISPESRSVDVQGYAVPGVLQDCSAPGETVPHTFQKMNLRAIAEQLCKPFGIPVVFQADVGPKFSRVKLTAGQEIFELLADLGRQRNLVLSNTASGGLLFWRSVPKGDPVATFDEGRPPVSEVSAQFSPQNYFSQITGFNGCKRGRAGVKHTEKNPWLKGVLRPTSFELEDTEKGDAPEATKAKLARMFANAATYTLSNLPGWRDPEGRLWAPNTTIKLTAPSAMLYRRTELLIRTVTFSQDANQETTSLELVLPGAFSGEAPTFLPWDDPDP